MTRVLVGALAVLAICARASAQPPAHYDAVTDRGPRPKPALVTLGAAGFSFNDPAFGSRLWRVTDRSTRPGHLDRSYRTPSGTHQNAWSADGSLFYVVSTDGTIVPFAFDASSGAASRINAARDDEGGLTLRFYIEPHFSYVTPALIYGSASGGSLRTIDQFDFRSGQYTRLLDLDQLVPGLSGTFVGGIGSSSGDPERLVAFFGGASQDRHHYVVVFDKDNRQPRRVLDTARSTLDGRRTTTALDFNLHHAFIDRTGRFVLLYPTSADRAAPRNAAPVYVWDTASDTITPMPSATALPNGHDAYGYGMSVNQDCCTASPTWDAAQWQIRALERPLSSRDLIGPVIAPKEVYLAEHPSWHNAQPDRLVPFITATYRYGDNDAAWRPWDDEVIAVETSVGEGQGAEVWRFAPPRSDVRDDGNPSVISFWYTPRPNVSPDGRWVLFTSNWEKTLGTDPQGDRGGAARQDVFLVQLKGLDGGDDDEGGPSLSIATAALPDGRRGRAYTAALQTANARGTVMWWIPSGRLPPGYRLDLATGVISGRTSSTGTWRFVVSVRDDASIAERPFVLTVRR